MFKNGQKVYKLSGYYSSSIEVWTFIRKESEKQGGAWILYNPENQFRTIHDISKFTGDKESVELYLFKNNIERINERKAECYREIEGCENDIYNAKQEIRRSDDEMTELNKKYKHLIEKYPEDFI